jgi:hypothetical protein
MTCDVIRLANGGQVIICGGRPRRRRCSMPTCRELAGYQCDGPAPRRKSGTCDRYLCASHRTQIGAGLEAGGQVEFGGQTFRVSAADTVDLCPGCVERDDRVAAQPTLPGLYGGPKGER